MFFLGLIFKEGDQIAVWKQREPIEEYFIFDDILEKLRCIYGVSDINEWLKPTEKSIHSPFLLNNIKDVALKIINAIEENKNICISYDVDSKI